MSHPVRETVLGLLTEAAGTLGWYHPGRDEEIWTEHLEHGEYVERYPEQFGLSRADINRIREADPKGYYFAFLDAAVANGWVRMNYYRGDIFLQAPDLQSARQAAYHYIINLGYPPDGAVVDLPGKSFELYPVDQLMPWVRKGKLPVNIIKHLRGE